MDEEILKSLENISGNLEYLIDFFQQNQNSKKNEDNKNIFDGLTNDFTSFNTYLKSIDANTQISNQKMSAYLDSLPILENNTNIIDNPEIEQFNQSILNLILKLDELKNSLGSISANLNLNLDISQIDSLKEKIQSDLMVNLDISNLDTTINNINSKLETLNNIPVNLNFGNAMENVTILLSQLNEIKEMKFDNINLDIINPDNFQNIIVQLNELKNISNIDLNDLKTSLLDISKIDLSNIKLESNDDLEIFIAQLNELKNISNLNLDSLKNSIQEISNLNLSETLKGLSEPIKLNIDTSDLFLKINSLNDEFKKIQTLKIELDFNVLFTDKIQSLKTELLKTTSELNSSLIIEPTIKYKIDNEELNNLKSNLNDIEININPDNELVNKIKSELDKTIFDIKVTPVFSANPVIETKNEVEYKFIKDDKISNDDKILISIEENNKLISELIKTISKTDINKTEKIEIIPEVVTKQESIVNVSTESPISNNTNNTDISVLVALFKELLDVNKGMYKNMKKGNFNTDIDL